MGKLTAVRDDDFLGGFAELGAIGVDGLEDVFAGYYFTEYDMGVIESVSFTDHYDVELTRICVLFPTISHSNQKWIIMLMLKILIRKVLPIYTLPTCTIIINNIPSLTNIKRNYPMKYVSFIMKRLPLLPHPLLSSAKTSKIL